MPATGISVLLARYFRSWCCCRPTRVGETARKRDRRPHSGSTKFAELSDRFMKDSLVAIADQRFGKLDTTFTSIRKRATRSNSTASSMT